MADVSAALVKELREKTGAGMMDCKKALAEAGNLEAAIDWLRKKGLSQAAKKAGRVTAEGLIGIVVDGRRGAMVELNSETDFVARNQEFQNFVKTLAKLALDNASKDADALGGVAYPGTGKAVRDQLTDFIATIGENMALRRVATVEVSSGVVGSYIHSALAPGLGKIGVLVGVETPATGAAVETLAKQVAMHVAAANPQVVSRQDLNPADIERERRVLLDQAKEQGKPEAVAEKMVEGRLRRYYEETCLLDQAFVMDDKSRVGQVVEAAAKQAGSTVAVKSFVRLALGEGVAKKEDSFANDVAAALKS